MVREEGLSVLSVGVVTAPAPLSFDPSSLGKGTGSRSWGSLPHSSSPHIQTVPCVPVKAWRASQVPTDRCGVSAWLAFGLYEIISLHPSRGYPFYFHYYALYRFTLRMSRFAGRKRCLYNLTYGMSGLALGTLLQHIA